MAMCKALTGSAVKGLPEAKHNHSVYLGVTHTTNICTTVAKLQSRYNLVSKLTGCTWGVSANNLHMSAVAFCYSLMEYSCPA